jgi:hypothetical protein
MYLWSVQRQHFGGPAGKAGNGKGKEFYRRRFS